MLSKMMATPLAALLLLLVSLFGVANAAALEVDLESADSIKAAAKLVAKKLISYYHGDEPGQTPGILPGPPPDAPYYWWQAGAMWGTFVDYWHYTGDTTYNAKTFQALQFQTGPPDNAYMPQNWTASLGNDDQGFWGMSAMLAAEVGFPDPPADQPQWLALAQAVFNTQIDPDRRDDVCGGGLRWQIYSFNGAGYTYKNTIANAVFLNIGARLARYTNNQSYADWAEWTYSWLEELHYIDDDYNVYDGGYDYNNCTVPNRAQFSYNAAILIHGGAIMYNITEDEKWKTRVNGLVNRTLEFFFPEPDRVMVEIPCEGTDQCNTDQHSFKGYMHRALATAVQVAPFTRDMIMPYLKASTAGAARACLDDGTCGFLWNQTYDGDIGDGPAGQEMSALAALSTMLIALDGEVEKIKPPLTNTTGGTSVGDPDAGTNVHIAQQFGPIEGKDRGGAGFLTVVVIVSIFTTLLWMAMEWSE
ncbi:glycoside hydrolase family 76 protein [Bombardia bombarda]|uniref:Mannan endo-1,6-alpha-mannosidase n=1 Tax=Bombardia bombarda TaxID=252184 RepID=A0AA39X1B2_9PEZI|nr:glycoside hydrolase family 76 protein [Bombardia bombarda]